MVLSIAMLTAGLFTMDRAQKAQEFTIKSSRITEMRSALESAILRASTIYRTEANCDPAILQRKLSYLQTDGTLKEPQSLASPVPATDHTNRILNVTVNSRVYEVSFGAVTPLAWTAGTDPSLDTQGFPAVSGTSQDAEIEVWTTVPGQATGTTTGTRTSMTGVLINSCQILCERKLPADGKTAAGEVCLAGSDASIANNPGTDLALNSSISPSPSTFLNYNAATARSAWPCASTGTLYLGNLPVSSDFDDDPNATAPTVVNALDLAVLTQYLQQRDTNWITSGETIAAVNAKASNPSCADVNLDGQVTDMDRTLLQKWLRGYLYRLPVNPDGRQ